MIRRPPRSPLFPSTPLFRSCSLLRDLYNLRAPKITHIHDRLSALSSLYSQIIGNQPSSLDKRLDRKSTRLNSSHANISYAVFCLKKKKLTQSYTPPSPLSHF